MNLDLLAIQKHDVRTYLVGACVRACACACACVNHVNRSLPKIHTSSKHKRKTVFFEKVE